MGGRCLGGFGQIAAAAWAKFRRIWADLGGGFGQVRAKVGGFGLALGDLGRWMGAVWAVLDRLRRLLGPSLGGFGRIRAAGLHTFGRNCSGLFGFGRSWAAGSAKCGRIWSGVGRFWAMGGRCLVDVGRF